MNNTMGKAYLLAIPVDGKITQLASKDVFGSAQAAKDFMDENLIGAGGVVIIETALLGVDNDVEARVEFAGVNPWIPVKDAREEYILPTVTKHQLNQAVARNVEGESIDAISRSMGIGRRSLLLAMEREGETPIVRKRKAHTGGLASDAR